ncbi:helix-turn-helix domain-containing protein [Sphingobacterium psychroaquaticum]|uniref:AraC-type DNA-binding protein n=1 Tax=Sphingobacterium psychroaquaticum TaxID=561061 RepID=A0A1X7IMW3_9SPHI|nr:AraC family transcriptional regulator [Sphingobacterium psychroaquaticum]SMG15708.1 AraC-type DNA-binding protein [Sphingobacterium psychroaquaticum]
MDDIATIDIHESSLSDKPYFTRFKPEYCAFPVVGLQWRVIPYQTCEVARQARSLLGTHIRLFEVDVGSVSQVRFSVGKSTAFLLFLLRGKVRFCNERHMILTQIQFPTYYLTYSPAGKLFAEMDRGEHSLLIIGLESGWFMPSNTNLHRAFAPLLEMWSVKSPTPILLPKKEITDEVWKTLAQIRTAVVENMDDGLKVLKYVSKCLDIYHTQLTDRKELNRYEDLVRGKILKEYLSANYMFEEECRTERILENLGWAQWTLRTVASNTFGCSVGRYVAKLRIDKAVELLVCTDMMVRDIAIRIGFSSAISFIRAFKKNKGISPNEYRNTKRDY